MFGGRSLVQFKPPFVAAGPAQDVFIDQHGFGERPMPVTPDLSPLFRCTLPYCSHQRPPGVTGVRQTGGLVGA